MFCGHLRAHEIGGVGAQGQLLGAFGARAGFRCVGVGQSHGRRKTFDRHVVGVAPKWRGASTRSSGPAVSADTARGTRSITPARRGRSQRTRCHGRQSRRREGADVPALRALDHRIVIVDAAQKVDVSAGAGLYFWQAGGIAPAFSMSARPARALWSPQEGPRVRASSARCSRLRS